MAIRHISTLAALGLAALALAGCQQSDIPKDLRPVDFRLVARMQALQMDETAPILVRLFKESSEVEVWKQRRDGQYALLKIYAICKWSGKLGPKIKEGDRQAPEGFYNVTPAQMNPNSSYYLSFNIGFPNAFDQALGRTGTNLMVHGACSSAGCYSMTDEAAGELFALAREAFRGGQRDFQFEAYPFRMTPENLAAHRDDPNMPFWQMLKVGYDHFEVTRRVPKVDVCDKKYVFDADAGSADFKASGACPAYQVPAQIASAVAAKEASDQKKFDSAVARLEAKAEKDAALAERANQPTLLARMMGRGSKEPEAPQTAAAVVSPPLPRVAPAEDAAEPTPIRVASAPLPRQKPDLAGDSDPAPVAKALARKPQKKATDEVAKAVEPSASVDAGVAATDTVGATAAAGAAKAEPVTAPDPAATDATVADGEAPGKARIGTFVKKKFLWPEDQPVMTGASPPLASDKLIGPATN